MISGHSEVLRNYTDVNCILHKAISLTNLKNWNTNETKHDIHYIHVFPEQDKSIHYGTINKKNKTFTRLQEKRSRNITLDKKLSLASL